MLITNTGYHRLEHTLHLLLEDLAEKSGLGIVFTNKGELLDEDYKYMTRVNFCTFCYVLEKHSGLSELCNLDHQKRGLDQYYAGKFHICHAGLFNLSFPIALDKEIVASILMGQRKLVGREEESNKKFNILLGKINLPKEENILLEKEFANIEIINQEKAEHRAMWFAKYTQRIIEHLIMEEKYNRTRINSSVHELLLPMQSLIIEAENLKEETYSEKIDISYLRESAPKICFEVEKLNFHARNIQKMMEMPVVKSKYEFKITPIYPLIDQARRRFELEAKARGIELKNPSYTGGTFPRLRIVENEIIVALNNLYSNAIKYSFSKSQFSGERFVTTECSDEVVDSKKYFTMDISNFGVGILRDEITSGKIFIPGFRGSLSRDRHRTGMGVGLHLVKEIIVRIHNGKIHIQSEDRQSGYLTTIRIMLPY